jgi:hypothetical protein
MPNNAIANGLYCAQLPEQFSDTTRTEHAMLNPLQISVNISTVRGGLLTAIKSHSYFLIANPGPPTTLLPRDISDTFRVTISGALTNQQKAMVKKSYECRKQRLDDQFNWYKRNNKHYQNLQYNSSNIQPLTIEETSETIEIEQNHNRNATNDKPMLENIIHYQSSLLQKTNVSIQDYGTGNNHVNVSMSNQYFSPHKKDYFTKGFPELFPYGRGGLEEPRRKHLTMTQFHRNNLKLSSRLFQTHQTYSMVIFDILSKMRGRSRSYLSFCLDAKLGQDIMQITKEDLELQLKYQELRKSSIQKGTTMPPKPSNLAHKMTSKIEYSMGAMLGTNQERQEGRKDLMAYCTQFGQIMTRASKLASLS